MTSDFEQEPVELGFRQRIGAFLLDRILGGQHVEWARQRMLDAADRHPVFLHRLQQGGLGAWAGAVDLVGHQQLAEHRPRHEAEAAPPVGCLIQDFAAQDIGRHQVRGELHPLALQAEDGAERLHQPALAKPRHTNQQQVAA